MIPTKDKDSFLMLGCPPSIDGLHVSPQCQALRLCPGHWAISVSHLWISHETKTRPNHIFRLMHNTHLDPSWQRFCSLEDEESAVGLN